MIKLSGTITTVEKAAVEVSIDEFYREAMEQFTPGEFAIMARRKWLSAKGLGTDVKLTKNSAGVYYWSEYENNGSHYSGYYERHNAYKEGDEVIWEQFSALIDNLK